MTDPMVLANACATYLRPVSGFDANGVPTFTPPLTPAEQLVLDRILRVHASLVPGITPTEWQAIQSDIDGLQTYQGLASPTLAQTVQAVKAQSRILRAILKN